MNPYSELFERQRQLFATNVTRTYEWRVEQLDRMAAMVGDNEKEIQQAVAEDFKTSPLEYDFETFTSLGEVLYQKSQLQTWMAPTEAPVPRRLRESGHTAKVIREPCGVTLVIGPFNGPLTLFIGCKVCGSKNLKTTLVRHVFHAHSLEGVAALHNYLNMGVVICSGEAGERARGELGSMRSPRPR